MKKVARTDCTIGLVTVGLSVCLSFNGFAQSLATPDAGAKQWLLYVDGGDYLKGWQRAGSPFKAQVTAPVLQSKIAPVREPLGAIMERRLFKVTFSNTAPGLPEGKYAIVQFSSRFANKPVTDETVWLELENDNWAVIGYFIGPNFPTTAGPDQSQPTAEVATAPGANDSTHEEMAEAGISRMNGYAGGPKGSHNSSSAETRSVDLDPKSQQAEVATKEASSGISMYVQLGSFKSAEAAEAQWNRFNKKPPLNLSSHSIERADLGQKGIWYRLLAAGGHDRKSAVSLCDRIKASGEDCIVQNAFARQ
jgi:Protein of unknown function (DUF4019)/SPOR domain